MLYSLLTPAYFVVSGGIANGDQNDPGFPYHFDTRTGGGSKSRIVPTTVGYGRPYTTDWGTLSVAASIGAEFATVTFQGSMDPVDASRGCNVFYGCGWTPNANTYYSGIDVYVRGAPGTPFHIEQHDSGSLFDSVTTTKACQQNNWANAQASSSWSGVSGAVSATSEHGPSGYCGIDPPKYGSADVSLPFVLDRSSTSPTITYNGQVYSYAYSAQTVLSLGIYAEQDPDFTATSSGRVTVSIAVRTNPTFSLHVKDVRMVAPSILSIKTERDFGSHTGHVMLDMTIEGTDVTVDEYRASNVPYTDDVDPIMVDLSNYDNLGHSVPRFSSNQQFDVTAWATLDDGTSVDPDTGSATILLPVVIVPGVSDGNGGDGTFPQLENLFTSRGKDIRYELRSSQGVGHPRYPTLYTLSYATTKASFAQGAGALDQLITGPGGVLNSTWAAKVNIVGHSKGGLVARKYIQDMAGTSPVKELVTAQSPHLGSVEASSLPGASLVGITNLSAIWPWLRYKITESYEPSYSNPALLQDKNPELARLNQMALPPNDPPFPTNVLLTLVTIGASWLQTELG